MKLWWNPQENISSKKYFVSVVTAHFDEIQMTSCLIFWVPCFILHEVKAILQALQAMLFQNVTVFLPKTLPSIFKMLEKSGTCQNSNLTYFRRPSFWDDINLGFAVTTSALDFKQLYIIRKFYQIKQVSLSERIPYLVQTNNFY